MQVKQHNMYKINTMHCYRHEVAKKTPCKIQAICKKNDFSHFLQTFIIIEVFWENDENSESFKKMFKGGYRYPLPPDFDYYLLLPFFVTGSCLWLLLMKPQRDRETLGGSEGDKFWVREWDKSLRSFMHTAY